MEFLPSVLLPWLGTGFPSDPNRGEPRPARAEDETVVSARKIDEALARTPLSVTAVSGEEIETAGTESLRQAAIRVPNVLFSEFSARRLSFPFVRGIGSGINDPAVITYIDDVPQFGFGGTNLPLVAVERVEFLRGPQGTLYGRNALGGLLHVRGRRPTEEQHFGVGAGFGSFDLEEYSGSYSGPLGAGLRGDIAVLDSQRDGYTTNDFSGNDVDHRDAFFGRSRVLWNPDTDTELEFALFGERARDGGFVLSDLNDLRKDPHHIDQDFEGLANRDVFNPSLVWRCFGEGHDFTSVSSWETWDVLELSDFDFTANDFLRRRSEEEQSFLYQELRFASTAESGPGVTRWVAGASGFLSDSERQAENDLRPDGAGILFPVPGQDLTDGQFDDWGAALFGEVGIPVGAEFELSWGVRYDRETKEVSRLHTFDAGGGPIVLDQADESETFDELLPMMGATWFAGEDSLVFVRAARGFKAGGFNLTSPPGSEEFAPEFNWTYELGGRVGFADGRASVAATAFLVDWKDMQLSQFDATAGGFVENAGESESRGVELEGRGELCEGLDGFATFGLLDTEIEEFTDSFGTDTSGNELPFAPDSTWSLGLTWSRELDEELRWSLQGDYGRTGDFFYDAGNREGDSFGLANFRAALDGRLFGVSVWVRNAFDEEYELVAFQPSPANPNLFVGESAPPRVLGFTVSIHR